MHNNTCMFHISFRVFFQLIYLYVFDAYLSLGKFKDGFLDEFRLYSLDFFFLSNYFFQVQSLTKSTHNVRPLFSHFVFFLTDDEKYNFSVARNILGDIKWNLFSSELFDVTTFEIIVTCFLNNFHMKCNHK